MKHEDFERAVIILARIERCNCILDMIEKSKRVGIVEGDRSGTIQDPRLVEKIVSDIKEHREKLQLDFELLGV